MKIKVSTDGRERNFKIPNTIVFSALRTAANKAARESKADRETRKRFKAALHETRRKYSDMIIAEIETADGEEIEVRL